MKRLRQSILTLFALAAALTMLAAGDPSGAWKIKVEAQGRSVESTLSLQWTDNSLTGTIENQMGRVEISDAQFADDQVTFTVVRKVGRGLRKKKFTLHYTGKLEGDTLKGTIETTNRDKQPVNIAWEAQRVK